MISAGDFRNGVTFEMDGNIYQVVDFQHVKPGKGAAFVRAKIKNIKAGTTIERTFNPSEKFDPAFIERKDMQYLYNEGDTYHFMDNETFEQISLEKDLLPPSFKFVKENTSVKINSHNGQVFGVEPENFVVLEVTHTEPGIKGDTATGADKPAELETGATVRVPLFVNIGDKLKIDTRNGTYMERA